MWKTHCLDLCLSTVVISKISFPRYPVPTSLAHAHICPLVSYTRSCRDPTLNPSVRIPSNKWNSSVLWGSWKRQHPLRIWATRTQQAYTATSRLNAMNHNSGETNRYLKNHESWV